MKSRQITIYKAFGDLINPMPADKSAFGSLPASAFQYCEAVRVASAYGYYVFSPASFVLSFDGHQIFTKEEDGSYSPLTAKFFDDDQWADWVEKVPGSLSQSRIPYISTISVPGYVQLWSGFFVKTSPGVSTIVRPVVNYNYTQLYTCMEGIVATDEFAPKPLFVQLKINKTDVDIGFSRNSVVFQFQPIDSSCYVDYSLVVDEGFDGFYGLSHLRDSMYSNLEPRSTVGSYAAKVRKSNKK